MSEETSAGSVSSTVRRSLPRLCFAQTRRFCSVPFRSLLRNIHSAKLRLLATLVAQDDTRGAVRLSRDDTRGIFKKKIKQNTAWSGQTVSLGGIIFQTILTAYRNMRLQKQMLIRHISANHSQVSASQDNRVYEMRYK